MKLKKNQSRKTSKAKQIIIKRIRTKIDMNTNQHNTFDF
jgi:hypothetical protein